MVDDIEEPVGEYPALSERPTAAPEPLHQHGSPEQFDEDERWLLGHIW